LVYLAIDNREFQEKVRGEAGEIRWRGFDPEESIGLTYRH
jgi:hypothetical protein